MGKPLSIAIEKRQMMIWFMSKTITTSKAGEFFIENNIKSSKFSKKFAEKIISEMVRCEVVIDE
tara:strand:- start:1242 stop:1433 length:192 start_codon:yes stop_codon:yes gene_type:complete